MNEPIRERVQSSDDRLRREETVLHRPATELVPESVLAGMERDGWTPTQVRELIASYRALKSDAGTLANPDWGRLWELLDRVVDTPGKVASALSASEWHELRGEFDRLRDGVKRGGKGRG